MNAACSSLPPKGGDEHNPHDEEELLVLDPPADYLRHLPDLGLEVIDVTHVPGIGGQFYHLRIKDGAHPFHAGDKHEKKFGDVAWTAITISNITQLRPINVIPRVPRQNGKKRVRLAGRAYELALLII